VEIFLHQLNGTVECFDTQESPTNNFVIVYLLVVIFFY